MDPAKVCASLGGVARTAQLSAVGISSRRLRSAVVDGSLLRLREGVYADPAVDPARLHAARHGGRLACFDALRWHGVWVLPESSLHIALQPGGRYHEHQPCSTSVVRHWDTPGSATGQPVEVGPALAQLSRCGSAEAFLVALESALAGRRPKLAQAGLARLATCVRPEHRVVLSFASPVSESGLESVVRWRLHHLGIACRAQVELPGVGRVDLVVGDRLILELDGRAHHSSEIAFALDRRRDAAAAALGFVTLRFSYSQVMHQWSEVEDAITRAVEDGLHETETGRRYRALASPHG